MSDKHTKLKPVYRGYQECQGPDFLSQFSFETICKFAPQCAYVMTLRLEATFQNNEVSFQCRVCALCVGSPCTFAKGFSAHTLYRHVCHVCQQNLHSNASPVFERECKIRFCKMRARGPCLSSQLRASRWFMAWECHPATSLCPENPMYSVYSFHLILLHKISRMLLWAFSG